MGLANFIWILSIFCNYDTTPLYQQNSTFIYYNLPIILGETFINLRPRAHVYELPKKDNRNFMSRVLYSDIY